MSSYLEEVLDPFGIIAVAFPANTLDLFDLARLAGGLDVLEMHVAVLAEVHDASKEVEQTCEQGCENVENGVKRGLYKNEKEYGVCLY